MRVIFNRCGSFSGKYLFLALLLSIAAFLNCASTQKNNSTLEATDRSLHHPQSPPSDTLKKAASPVPENAAAISSVTTCDTTCDDTVAEDPDELIETAKQECTDGNYASADSNLKRAVKAIEILDADNTDGEEWLPASRDLENIVAIYTDKMPPPYSVPENITMAAFQKQMVRSLDSLKFMPSDSLVLIAKQCQKNSPMMFR